MISKRIREKGLLTKLLEQGIRILLKKECKKIRNLKIDIISTSTQIIRGEIQKINMIAEDINYKDLVFEKIMLEVNDLKISFKQTNNKFYFQNDPKIKFKISLSQNSLRKVFSSKNWIWIGNMISKNLLNQDKIEDIKIKNGKLLIKTNEKNKNINVGEHINIKTERGKVYLENKTFNKIIQIPIEDKIIIKNVNIENNLINIFGNSSISF